MEKWIKGVLMGMCVRISFRGTGKMKLGVGLMGTSMGLMGKWLLPLSSLFLVIKKKDFLARFFHYICFLKKYSSCEKLESKYLKNNLIN